LIDYCPSQDGLQVGNLRFETERVGVHRVKVTYNDLEETIPVEVLAGPPTALELPDWNPEMVSGCTVKPVNSTSVKSTKPVDSNVTFGTRFACPYDMSLEITPSLQIALPLVWSQGVVLCTGFAVVT
jgi:hypothetical protein